MIIITIIIGIIMTIMVRFTTLCCCQLFDFRILAGILVFGIIAALVATVAYIRFFSWIMYDDKGNSEGLFDLVIDAFLRVFCLLFFCLPIISSPQGEKG